MKILEIALLIIAALGCFALVFAKGALLLGQIIMFTLGCLLLIGALRLIRTTCWANNTQTKH